VEQSGVIDAAGAVTRAIVAEFHKDSGGRLKLWSMTVIKENGRDGRVWICREQYNVEWSRKYGYIFEATGFGGSCDAIDVSGIYFTSGDVKIKENPCQLVDARDKPPWRGKRTKAIRTRNRTRRLRVLPKVFELETGWDLLDFSRLFHMFNMCDTFRIVNRQNAWHM
jgi:hypothetical protein